uniref:Holliday junction resolvase n=1 Tax=Dictyoglomus turgidum TaxID=513050 RepID=A0A7C3SNB0_9BACT
MKISPKRKGNIYERSSAKFWSEKLKVVVKRTPMSGAFFNMPADLLVFGDSVLNEFVIDVKSEQNLLTKKVLQYFQKNKEDAQGKKAFLEIYVNYDKNSPYVLISREDFAKILIELDGYRKESQDNS